MSVIHIGSRREVCWDEYLMDESAGVRVEMHKPEYRGVAFTCDAPWEGNVSGYFDVIGDGMVSRLYYRGADIMCDEFGNTTSEYTVYFCCAESADGKTFTRVPVNEFVHNGRKDNNIITDRSDDNFVVFKDTNPACPKEERFKALMDGHQKLILFTSADGVHFTEQRVLADDGAYDSMNLCFWDHNTKQYYLYYRGLHGKDGKGSKWGDIKGAIIRDVRMRTSKDFVNWSEPKHLDYGADTEDYELYTSQIKPYYRADHVFLGIPTRYMERKWDAANFKYLPDRANRINQINKWGRSGTAMTDCVLMTSRDGVNFRRTDEAFMTPGIERDCNWYYGDCYVGWGMVETAGDLPGASNEISIYMGRNYRVDPVELCRYAVRLDGFFSWHCDFKRGYVLTKPFSFEGNALEINFATSALGYVRIRLCDENGDFIEGYDSGNLFGDSVSRNVDFEGELSKLSGETVRMRIDMKDAELYSFRFGRDPFV